VILALVALVILIALIALAAVNAELYSRRVSARFAPQGFMLETDEGRVHCRTFGPEDGLPVLFIHGAASSARDIALAFAEAAGRGGIRGFAMDRPGLGWTPPFGRQPDRLEAHARVAMACAKALGLRNVVVVGHSYGATVALRMAIDFPGELAGAVLVAIPSTAYVGPASWYNYVATWPVIGRLTRWLVPLIGPLMLEAGLTKTFSPANPPPDYVERAGLPLLFRPRSFLANARDLSSINRELANQQDLYQDVDVPLAIIASPDDQVVYTERHSEPLSRAAQDTRYVRLPGGGHMPHYQNPDIIVEHARALAGGNDGTARVEQTA